MKKMQTIQVGTGVNWQKPVFVGSNKEVIMLHKGETQADVKYNGNRMQVHIIPGNNPLLLSKSLIVLNPECFPEIVPELQGYKQRIIFDSEVVGAAGGYEGLRAIQNRPKLNPNQAAVEQYPLQLRIFDVLYCEKPLIDLPLTERRKILEHLVSGTNVLPAETRLVTSEDELSAYYADVVFKRKEEGLVCKDTKSLYVPGSESKKWLKRKELETLDCVVTGFYKGEGKEADAPFAAVLLSVYNDMTGKYETITKVGIQGALREEIAERVFDSRLDAPPENLVLNPKLFAKGQYKRKIPFAYVAPELSVVVTVKAMDITYSDNWHSCGGVEKAHSLMIPVIELVRDPTDKTPEDATKTRQVIELYKAQNKNSDE